MLSASPQSCIAHIRKEDGVEQTLREHLLAASALAGALADKVGLSATGRLLGLLHDFGKYSGAFQHYLRECAK